MKHQIIWHNNRGNSFHAYIKGAATGDGSVCGMPWIDREFQPVLLNDAQRCRGCLSKLTYQHTTGTYYYLEQENTVAAPRSNTTKADLEARVKELSAALDKAKADHKKDIELIGTNMKKLADKHDLCSIFYNAVDDLNGDLTEKLDVHKYLTGYLTVTLRLAVKDIQSDESIEGLTSGEYFDEYVQDALHNAISYLELPQGQVAFVGADFDNEVEKSTVESWFK